MGTQTETLKERLLEEEKQLFFISPESWFVCPVCNHEGQKEDLLRFGHSCCREFIMEFDEAI